MNDVLSKETLAEVLSEIVEMEPTDPRFVEMSALIVAYYESMRISLEQAEKERDAKEAARCEYSEEYGKLLENHIAQHDRLEKAERELLAALRRPQGKPALGEIVRNRKWDDTGEVIRNVAPTGPALDLHVKIGQPTKAAVLYNGEASFDGKGHVTISVDEFNRLVAGQKKG